MANKLKNKVVLLTGAAQGIGKSIAINIASEGAHIILVDINLEILKETYEQEISQISERSKTKSNYFLLDVTKESQIIQVVENIIQNFGRIDILVNNAGVLSSYSIIDLKEQEWDRILSVNLKGVYLMTKIVLKQMINRRIGKIINIASDSGISGKVNLSHYCSSKFGVIGFTQSIAKEVAKYNILVNAICPGPTHTDLHFKDLEMQSKISGISKDNLLSSELDMIPLGRLAKPEEIARLVTFLASDENTYITGESINISGGFEMH